MQNVALTRNVTTFDVKCNNFFNANCNNFLTQNVTTLNFIYKEGDLDILAFSSS